jgi:hypothetical protein
MDENNRVSYPDLGVEFIFPRGLSHVGVIKLSTNGSEGRGTFDPKRHIISVLLYNTETKEEMTDFGEEGFDIKVEFMAIDLANVDKDEEEALEKLDLGYYDARKCDFRWVSFRGDNDNHGYKELPTKYRKVKDDKWVGYAVVNIKKWVDPEMAWGP